MHPCEGVVFISPEQGSHITEPHLRIHPRHIHIHPYTTRVPTTPHPRLSYTAVKWYSMSSMERALYQKHRPQSFEDIVDQPQVVSVLKKAVESGHPAHAYLLTGPRGIGKTSIARIFSRALGCKDIDIFEIDAASYTSVEHIRDITTSVYTQPVESEYKVYILDEVHMLSKAAFNAFLKTLEEPPRHAVFVLVTTEAEKVPETVISRCVSLQFRQPSLAVLQDTVMSVAKKEGYTLSNQSTGLIALIADGSFRDSLTLLQKALFVSDSKAVDHQVVEEVLGAPKHQLVNDYLNALADGDIAAGINALTSVSGMSANMQLFAKLCIRKLRAALLFREQVMELADEYTDEDKDFIGKLSQKKGVTLDMLKRLVEASYEIPRSYVKALPLECVLLNK